MRLQAVSRGQVQKLELGSPGVEGLSMSRVDKLESRALIPGSAGVWTGGPGVLAGRTAVSRCNGGGTALAVAGSHVGHWAVQGLVEPKQLPPGGHAHTPLPG